MSLAESLEETLAKGEQATKWPVAVALARRLAKDLDSEEDGEAKDIATLGRLYLQTITQLGLIPAKQEAKGGGTGDGPVNPLIAQRDAARLRRAQALGQASS